MAIEVTKCLDPTKVKGPSGKMADAALKIAKEDFAKFGVLFFFALVVAAFSIPGGIAAVGLVGSFYLAATFSDFCDWWHNQRLLCLDADANHCAVGIVWGIETPEEKGRGPGLDAKLESFDNDYSINLLLSPAGPGDPASVFESQAVLVRQDAAIRTAGLPTMGLSDVAAKMTEPARCNVTEHRDVFANVAFVSDPEHTPAHASGLDTWEAYSQTHDPFLAGPQTDVWQIDAQKSDVGDLAKVVIPDTQLLHCEFEGTGMKTLCEWLPWFIFLSGALVTALAILAFINLLTLLGFLGLLVVLFWLFLLFLALVFLAAVILRKHSRQGDPEDAGWDPGAGEVRSIPQENLEPCGQWDKAFDLVGVMGRWVYDAGHTRGWNEFHPVRHVQLLSEEETEAKLAGWGWPPIRPQSDADAKALRDWFCREVERARQEGTRNTQSRPEWRYVHHPEVG